MAKRHDTRSPGRAAQPVQVYLDRSHRARLDRLAAQLGSTKSDVLRRALEALERELTDPAQHPALGIIGIAEHETVTDAGFDVAREHDRYFADLEDAGRAARLRRSPRKRRGE